MARGETDLDEEKRSYGALWLVLSLLLFVSGLWAIADDNVFRRPWKKWQAEFNRLEIARLEAAIHKEQERLDGDPAYQAAAKALAEARAQADRGDTARTIDALEHDLEAAKEQDLSKDLNLRFIKSELEELRYRYDEALHQGQPTDALLREIEAKEQVRTERQQA